LAAGLDVAATDAIDQMWSLSFVASSPLTDGRELGKFARRDIFSDSVRSIGEGHAPAMRLRS